VCRHEQQRLLGVSQSIATARRSLRGWLSSWGITEDDPAAVVIDDALLVLSELLTNAVKYSSDDVEVAVYAHHDHVEISVRDDNPTLAHTRPAGPAATGGWGIAMIETISQTWGQHQHDNGKTVWARLAVPTGSSLAHGCQLRP
jgi:anti-sigma regulatory factor (Ser/Thr protein kinase)